LVYYHWSNSWHDFRVYTIDEDDQKNKMTSAAMDITKNLTLGRVEKSGIVVTGILVLVNLILGSQALAVGVAVGGLLVIANFLAIRLLVGALIGKAYTKGYSIFILLVKMLVLVALVVAFFLFTKLNIYGFFIGVSGVVIVIIGESLRGNKDGAL
jgi:hypothetical protein